MKSGSSSEIEGCLAWASSELAAGHFFFFAELIEKREASGDFTGPQRKRAALLLAASYFERRQFADLKRKMDVFDAGQGEQAVATQLAEMQPGERAIAWYLLVQMEMRERRSPETLAGLLQRLADSYADGLERQGAPYPSLVALEAVFTSRTLEPAVRVRGLERLSAALEAFSSNKATDRAKLYLLLAVVHYESGRAADAQATLVKIPALLPEPPWRQPLVARRPDDADSTDRKPEAKAGDALWAEVSYLQALLNIGNQDPVDAHVWLLSGILAASRAEDASPNYLPNLNQTLSDILASAGATQSARIYLGAAAKAGGSLGDQWDLDVARRRLAIERHFVDPATLRRLAANVQSHLVSQTMGDGWVANQDLRREILDTSKLQIPGPQRSGTLLIYLTRLAGAVEYPAEASDALALLAGIDKLQGRSGSEARLTQAIALASPLTGRRRNGSWAGALYQRVTGNAAAEAAALVDVTGAIEALLDFDDVAAYWRLAELRTVGGDHASATKVLGTLERKLSELPSPNPVLVLETWLKLARTAFHAGDLSQAHTFAKKLGNWEVDNGVLDRARLAEAAAIVALTTPAVEQARAGQAAKTSLWYGSAASSDQHRLEFWLQHKSELERVSAQAPAGLGMDGYPVRRAKLDPAPFEPAADDTRLTEQEALAAVQRVIAYRDNHDARGALTALSALRANGSMQASSATGMLLLADTVKAADIQGAAGCGDVVLATEYFAAVTRARKVADVIDQLLAKGDSCSAEHRVRLVAARTELAIELAEPIDGAVFRLEGAIADVDRIGRLALDHPVADAIAKVARAIQRADVGPLRARLAAMAPRIFSPASLYGGDQSKDFLRAVGANGGEQLFAPAYVLLAQDRLAHALLSRASQSVITSSQEQLAKVLSNASLSNEVAFWRGELRLHRPADADTNSNSVLDDAASEAETAWNENRGGDLAVALTAAVEASRTERRAGLPGDTDPRSDVLYGAISRLATLSGKMLQRGDRSGVISVVDAIIAVTGELPIPEADNLAWKSLGQLLSMFLTESSEENIAAFGSRAKPLVKRLLVDINDTEKDESRYRTAAKILAAFRVWAPVQNYQDVIGQSALLLDELQAGKISDDAIDRALDFIKEVMIGGLAPGEPGARIARIKAIAAADPDGEAVERLMWRSTQQILSEALAEAIGRAEAGDIATAKQLLQAIETATAGQTEPVLDRTGKAIALTRSTLLVCESPSAKEAEALIGPIRDIQDDFDLRSELALVRALLARNFTSSARARLDAMAKSLGSLPDEQSRSEARGDIARFAAASMLLEKMDDDAIVRFSQAWDGVDLFVSRQEQVSVAHILLGLGRGDLAQRLYDRLDQVARPDSSPLLSAPNMSFSEIAFLSARLRLAGGDPNAALDQIGISRRARGGTLLDPLLDNRLDNGNDDKQPLLTVLATGSRGVSMLNWIGSPSLPSTVLAASAPPATPALVALDAAASLVRAGRVLSAAQQQIVLDELRSVTRSPTTMAFMRAQALASLPTEKGRESLRRMILEERIRRTQVSSESTSLGFASLLAVWPPASHTIAYYLAGRAPCESENSRLRSPKERSIDAAYVSLAGAQNSLGYPGNSGAISDLTAAVVPDYLTDQDPTRLPKLAEGEAALVIVGGGRQVYSTVIRGDRVVVHAAKFEDDDRDIETIVREARVAIAANPKASLQGRPQLQSLARLVLWPVLADLKDVRHIVVVTTGAMSAIPLQLLPLDGSGPDPEKTRLDTRFITRVLPGLEPLFPSIFKTALPADPSEAPPAFFAVADPANLGSETECSSLSAKSLRTAEGYIDADRFRMFCSVPQTRNIARVLHRVLQGAPPVDERNWMRAGNEAREEDVVADTRLAQARIVLFATHGLVAQEVVHATGLNEPALVLSPPVGNKRPEDRQDGLLTAREIVAMRLHAEWVLLIACNSASGDGTPNGDALSGLADAFLAAGARGVIVSHWQIDPAIAAGFLQRLFVEWQDGKRRMDDALALTMQAMRQGDIFPGKAQRTEYQWAPFVVVAR